MIAARYARPVAALLAIALIPTVLHSYVGARSADGRRADRLPAQLSGLFGASTPRGGHWALEALDADEAIERQYGPDLTLFVARSYDVKRLYHHPELVVAYGRSFDAHSIVRFDQHEAIPVHVLSGPGRTAAYVVQSAEGFVGDPFAYEMRSALPAMFRARRQATLFFVHGRDERAPIARDSPTIALLLSAVQSWQSQP
jgi:hypothetical protein